MKAYDIPKSGKRGSVVAFKSRFGQCEREHTPSRKPRTAAQRRSQSDFGAASARWNYLTEDQRKAWRAYGRKVRSHPQGGQSGFLTGQMLYTAINRNQAALGLPPLDYPPERPEFGPNPVVGFRIDCAARSSRPQADRVQSACRAHPRFRLGSLQPGQRIL